ncbi:MAG: HAMP domain-containing sensor histidine kinase [Pseudomonadota bacterium]
MSKRKAVFSFIYQLMKKNVASSEKQITIIGILGATLPLYYLIYQYTTPLEWDSLALRNLGAVICVGLIIHKFWPSKIKYLFPFYYYFTLLYCLPFFFTILLLKNTGSLIAALSMMMAIILLVVLLDWMSFLVTLILGLIAGTLYYFFTTDNPHIPLSMLPSIALYLFVAIAGTIFNYKSAELNLHRLEGMATITSNIAHEIRTPLLGIKAGIEGLRRYMSPLFETYEVAKKNGLNIPNIRKAHLASLLPALDRMESETRFANTIIDMLLINVGKNPTNLETLHIYSINHCIKAALERYPFDSAEEKHKIHWNKAHDFQFLGSEILMVHIIFNLLKNALHFIVTAEKGEIFIWLEPNNKFNTLHFKDTGLGVPSAILPRIFERFYTTTLTGTGIGLSYCKMVMESFNGDMKCLSEDGEYTQFLLKFPKISAKKLPK